MMSSIIEFAAKTGVVAGCGLVNMAVNTAAGKVIDKKVQPKLPTRAEGVTDVAYAELCEKAQKKCDVKKKVAKGAIGLTSLLGTSVGASFAIGAIDGVGVEAEPVPEE